jgi:hypothetical protein
LSIQEEAFAAWFVSPNLTGDLVEIEWNEAAANLHPIGFFALQVQLVLSQKVSAG